MSFKNQHYWWIVFKIRLRRSWKRYFNPKGFSMVAGCFGPIEVSVSVNFWFQCSRSFRGAVRCPKVIISSGLQCRPKVFFIKHHGKSALNGIDLMYYLSLFNEETSVLSLPWWSAWMHLMSFISNIALFEYFCWY